MTNHTPHIPREPLATRDAGAGATSPRRPELLAPAGGPAPFAAAIAAGADAVYLGMGDFNARRKAENFDDAAFERACRQAHLAGARVYVTVNIVIKQDELPRALELVRRCTELGADAFIIQDWGLVGLVRRLMPWVEVHVSTQANIHDDRGAAWCRELGAERVTLSRELSIDEVAAIHDAVDIELEVFAHGSICFSYSGVCLLSSFACAGRSANRGMCAQPCRLPYELVDAEGRILTPKGRERALCPRDANTVDLLPRLIDAGAGALKLEGRMKAADYVFSVTDAYRRALDAALAGGEPSDDEGSSLARQLKRCFNRDFTHAYQTGTSGDEMMSYERSNNRGQVVGEVTGFSARAPRNRAERFRERDKGPAGTARIRLAEPVGAGDLIELRHPAEPEKFLTAIARAAADAGDVIEVEVPREMPAGSVARIIRSQRAIDAAKAVLARDVPRRRRVDVHVTARIGRPFAVTLSCTDDPALAARAEGFIVEAARTRPVTEGDLVEHVGRMGSTPFEPAGFTIELDEGCGMGFSAVHRVRAEACRLLEEAVLTPAKRRSERAAVVELPADPAPLQVDAPAAADPALPAENAEICVLVTSLAAADAARRAGAVRIYMSTDDLDDAGLSPADARERGIIPVLNEVCRRADHDRLDRWVAAEAEVAVGNVSELVLAKRRGASAEIRSCIPVHNVAARDLLAAHGASGIWLSPEATLDEIASFAPGAPVAMGIMVAGRPRVMTSEHCILQVADACIHDCARCALRRRGLFLRNIDGRRLPVTTDVHGRSHLYTDVRLDLSPNIPELLVAGVSRFLVDATLMDEPELVSQVGRVRRALEAVRAGGRPAARQRGASAGCLFVGVD